MTTKRTQKVTILLLLLVLSSFYLPAQNRDSTAVKLPKILDSLSINHNVFFTYESNLLKNSKAKYSAFKNLNLKESINLLRKITPFKIEYLGNKYYVIYDKKKESLLSKNDSVYQVGNSLKVDASILKENKITIKGRIQSQEFSPLEGASIIEKNTINGTTSSKNGYFSITLLENNPLEISFVGYEKEVIHLKKESFVTITLRQGESLDEVLIVGSRNRNRTIGDSPIATETININEATTKTSAIGVTQILQYSVPSFNATKQSGADGSDHITPATYRGLGPDQTLVLINGKRRHQSSLINLYGTRGRGNTGTDLNTIPTSAIKRIDILKDGASAQYGSDAIAGVINIILNDNTEVFNVNSTFGIYNADANIENRKPRATFDGLTYKLNVNYGTTLGKKGHFNFTSEFLSNDHTFRPHTPQRKQYGDASQNNFNLFLNTEFPINNESSFYAFGGYNYRNTEAFAFTRPKDSERNVIAIYPNGFNPIIASTISDKSFSIGFKTTFKSWSIDVNNTIGSNLFKNFIKETLNATLLDRSPTEFEAGGHQLTQNITEVDFSRHFPNKLHGINIAFGLEHRIENYKIFSGEEASYATYDVNGNIANQNTPSSELNTHMGIIRPGGSQGFPGYAPSNEVNRRRSNFSMYGDTEFDFSSKFMIATALRFERYSDFGNTLTTKIASRYKLTPKTTIRGAFSTGFRAPSLAQMFYNLSFTNFIGVTPTESKLIANNNPIITNFGIEKLKEEKAINLSSGFAYKPLTNFEFSLDAYYIGIKDRIILTGNFDTSNLDYNADNVQFFANGTDTETLGLDFNSKWKKPFNIVALTLSFSGNINRMQIKKIHHKDLDEAIFFGKREQYFLLASAPKSKFNFSLDYKTSKYNFGAHLTRFSRVKLIDWQISQDLALFNNSEKQRLEKATDTYKPRYIVDLYATFSLLKSLKILIGTNNVFNSYPSVQDQFTDSGGLWDATQAGSNGAFYYTKLQLDL